MGKRLIGIVLLFTSLFGFGQTGDLKLIAPSTEGWDKKTEGELFEFQINANMDSVNIKMIAPKGFSMELDSIGNFYWQTDQEMVSAEDEELYYYILFIGEKEPKRDSLYVELTVRNNPEQSVQTEIVIEEPEEETPVLEEIVIPKTSAFSLLHEGDTLSFRLDARMSKGTANNITYRFEEGEPSGASIDNEGNFTWVVPYSYVERLQQTREKHIFFIAEDENGNVVSKKIIFTVFHKNQAPEVDILPKFYVLLGTNNTYTISSDYVQDPDGDPIVFKVNPVDVPQGMSFNSKGRILWEPSRSQFGLLKEQPLKIPFYVEDQPGKERTEGFVMVEASFMDMPPEIAVVPNESKFTLNENERLHMAFHLSDPNGDSDLREFSFISEDERIGKELLIKNTDTQYEFVWTPGFDFVQDPNQKIEFNIRFFAVDKTNQSSEKSITIEVLETEDLSKKDANNYEIYKNTLVETLNLLDQLEVNNKQLEKDLKNAKKGKRNRAIVGASIGAITGLSPVITGSPESQQAVSVVGGTSTLTLGTLEAKDILGKSTNSINEKIKTNNELYNQFLSEGSSFARRYSTKKARRDSNFSYDLEKFRIILNSPKLATLELDANWENKKKVNDRRLKSTFSDYDAVDE